MNLAASRLVRVFGLPGLVGAIVLALTAVIFATAVTPLARQSRALDQQLASRRAPSAFSASASDLAHDVPLQAFYRFFQRSETTQDWLAKVHGAASAAGIDLRHGDYKVGESRYGLYGYQIVLPVTGTYPRVRTFLQNALMEIPVMSVDQVTIKRKSGADGMVDAEVTVTLYLARK